MTGRMDRRKRGGFTLLEICLVLFILVLIIGLCVPFATGWTREARFRQFSDKLQQAARTARAVAMEESVTQEIKFTPEGFETVFQAGSGPGDTNAPPVPPPQGENATLPEGMTWMVKRWPNREFQKIKEMQWVFRSNGLCEPLQFRFAQDDYWLEIQFDPLTAQVQNESYSF